MKHATPNQPGFGQMAQRSPRICCALLIILAPVLLLMSAAQATTVQDLVRLKGHERVILTGMGIVVGLNGTGDSSRKSLLAARPYAELLNNLGYPIPDLGELAIADSYALVNVTMTIPPTGVRDGDLLDVTVSTLFNAESLDGGELIVSPLRLPRRDSAELAPMALAQGSIVIEGDNPRSGIIRRGGQMIADIRSNPVANDGTITLVLRDEYAGYPVAAMLVSEINDEFQIGGGPNIAFVEDSKNIRIRLRAEDRQRPADFIAGLLTMSIDSSLIQTPARIVINQRKGIILVTGDVWIGPVGVRARGLSITNIVPPPEPTPENPLIEVSGSANMDISDRRSRASTRLVDLLQAFDQLNVPIDDQIAIIHEMKKTGALHAEIVLE